VFGDEPGCVYPSTVRTSVAFGSHVVKTIVWTPAPGMLKSIVSAPGFAFASRIAWRSEPAPESALVVTVNVAAVPTPVRTRPSRVPAALFIEISCYPVIAGGRSWS
jgi:hypothetical protein